jgi:hypothetical protein
VQPVRLQLLQLQFAVQLWLGRMQLLVEHVLLHLLEHVLQHVLEHVLEHVLRRWVLSSRQSAADRRWIR